MAIRRVLALGMINRSKTLEVRNESRVIFALLSLLSFSFLLLC